MVWVVRRPSERILGLAIAKIIFKKMKFNFSIGHSERGEGSRSWAAAAASDSSLRSE
jgi:hypothetical protein